MIARKFCYIFMLILLPAAHAIIIQGIQANQDSYSNGDLVELTIFTNARDLQVNADFSQVDSNFNSGMVLVESPENFTYKVWYPISFSNTRGSKIYNVIITLYQRSTDSSSSVTYGINLNNEARIDKIKRTTTVRINTRMEDIDPIVPTNQSSNQSNQIKVQAGKIMVCTVQGCKELTEAEYEKARQVIISDGTVQLSGLTYQQLKNEISRDINTNMSAEVQQYVDKVVEVNSQLQASIIDMRNMVSAQTERMMNETNATRQMVRRSTAYNIAAIVAVIVLVMGAMYLLYLKTNTTWL